MDSSEPAPDGGTGLLVAWKRCQYLPDPAGLEAVRGNNGAKLRAVAKLAFVLAGGKPGGRFYLGGAALGKLLGVPPKSALRVLAQLGRRGVIRRTWTGRMCRRDADGNEYAGGDLVRRASEYVFKGLGAPK